MAEKKTTHRTFFSYVIDYDSVKPQNSPGFSYEIKRLLACVVDYNSNTIIDKYSKELKSKETCIEDLYQGLNGFYKKHEETLIFNRKPFLINKYFNYILIKSFLNNELIKDEDDFVFSLDCFDIFDIYKIYSFCKTGKVVETDLETMLGDFGIVAQESGTEYFDLVNSSRLSVQMMKKIGLIFIMSDMGGSTSL